MEWAVYQLVYRALAPMRIGWRTLGYINLTRHFIPGKNMWAAFTENLVRSGPETSPAAYLATGELLRSQVLPSYFYPALKQDGKFVPLLPRYSPDGIWYGSYSSELFEHLFIGSLAQTAILPHSNASEDESLHESEYISPEIANEGTEGFLPVYYMGYLFIHPSATINCRSMGWTGKDVSLESVLREVSVGGERKYGWGRMRLDRAICLDSEPSLFGYPLAIDCADIAPRVCIPANNPIFAHLPVSTGLTLQGQIEPLVGREWAHSGGQIDRPWGYGQHVTDAHFCWAPGSSLLSERSLFIGPYGILAANT
jgi:hypothetical protein